MKDLSQQRILIIGNSGSGKSTLASQLGALLALPAIDLDLLHWQDDGAGPKRDEAAAITLAQEAAAAPRWIMEGVYGWLAAAVMTRVGALLWLDLPWDICRAGLLARGPRRGASAQDQVELLAWAEAYWTRMTPSSFAGHARLFTDFSGAKQRLVGRDAVDGFLSALGRASAPLPNPPPQGGRG
jgi:adenylate kinase family enzyme